MGILDETKVMMRRVDFSISEVEKETQSIIKEDRAFGIGDFTAIDEYWQRFEKKGKRL